MRATLNLNALATHTMNGAQKVRVKVEDGVLMIKPTDRVCGKALPKGEKLVKLSRKNSSTVKFGLRGVEALGLEFGNGMSLVPAPRGYFKLVAGHPNAELGYARVCKG